MSTIKRFCATLISLIMVGLATAAPVPPIKAPLRISPANADQVQQIHELQRDVWRIVLGPGRHRVSLLGWETSVDVLDSNTLHLEQTIARDRKLVQFAAAADGQTVAWSENGTKIEVLNLRTNKSLEMETLNDQPYVAFAPDGGLVAAGGYGTHAKMWELATGKLLESLDAGPTQGGLTPAFSPNGKLIAIGHRNAETRIFEVASGKLLFTLNRKMSHELKFSPDGRVLAVAYVDGGVGLWDMNDGSILRSCASGAQEIYTLDWSPEGDVLATAGLHGKITLWDPRALSALKELDAPEWVIQVRFNSDGTRLFTAGGPAQKSPERKVTIWGVP